MKHKIIPAKYKKIVDKDKEYWILIFDVQDFLTDEKPRKYQKEIYDQLMTLVEDIKKLLPCSKPSKVARKNLWKIGHKIIKKREEIAEKYGIYITNLIEVIAANLNLAPRTVNFFVQFCETVSEDDINEEIPWKIYQTCLLLKNKSMFKKCIEKYVNGELRNVKEVLEYVQKCNRDV